MEQWYYVQKGERQGPVEKEHIQSLLDAGEIDTESLVWNESMENWEPASGFFNVSSTPSEPTTTPDAFPATESPTPEDSHGANACSECGMVFPQGELSNFGGKPTCGNCLGEIERKAKAKAATQQRFAPGNRRPTPTPSGSNSMAVTGFSLSIASIVCCCGILAIPGLICSIMGYRAAEENNDQGKGLALAGIIISIASVGLNIIGIIVQILAGFAEGAGY